MYDVWGQTESEHLSFGIERGCSRERAEELVSQLKKESPDNEYWYEPSV